MLLLCIGLCVSLFNRSELLQKAEEGRAELAEQCRATQQLAKLVNAPQDVPAKLAKIRLFAHLFGILLTQHVHL